MVGVRRSARILQLQKKARDRAAEPASFSPPASKVQKRRVPPQIASKPRRKRQREAGPSSHHDQGRPPSKPARTSLPSYKVEGKAAAKDNTSYNTSYDTNYYNTSNNTVKPIETWVQTNRWPSQYFEPDSQAGEDFFEDDSSLEEQMKLPPIPVVQYVKINGMRIPRPVRKIPTSSGTKTSDPNSTENNRKQREDKRIPYRSAQYPFLLEKEGSYMRDFDVKSTPKTVRDLRRKLLETDQTVPQDSLFHNDTFEKLCEKLQNRNEAMIIQDITRLIVPSGENLAICGATHLTHLVESVDQAWAANIPVVGPIPKPDYSIGFSRSSFTEEQLERLDPIIGTVWDTSFFKGTYRMYFPFLTCEVKSCTATFEIADRQNAHSMTVAARAVVELYRAVGREKELHREILAFSIAHDHSSVRIYGHYPIINGDKVTFYRYLIHDFSFTVLEGREKWTTYKFTKNVYNIWMPTHLKRICSAIDQLPSGIDFEVSELSDSSQLSKKFQLLRCETSRNGSLSRVSEEDSEPTPIFQPTDTSNTPIP